MNKPIKEIVRESINEVVYVSDIQNHGRGHRAKLSYTKNNRIPKNSKKTDDRIKTDKMDNSSYDTYEVPLKNGYTSYNITSIEGNDIMHFFKHFFNGSGSTKMKLDGVDYTMYMDDDEFNDFMETFVHKVKNVITYHAKKYGVDGKINTVCVYPVPSSSKFNEMMANCISNFNLFGKPIIEINQNFLKKDFSNIERDEDFIIKNKSNFEKKIDNKYANGKTVNDFVDNGLERLKALYKAQKQIEELNSLAKKIYGMYYTLLLPLKKSANSFKFEDVKNKVADMFCYYHDLYYTILKKTTFNNKITNKEQTIQGSKVLKSIDRNENDFRFKNGFYNVMTNTLLERGNSQVTGTPYCQSGPLRRLGGEITDLQNTDNKQDMYPKNIKITNWERPTFAIKNFANAQRMGLKNMFSITNDNKIFETESKKLKNTILVIFDDNLSGGATLSDICFQFNKIGVKNIIPITFGQMAEKTHFKGINFGSFLNKDKKEKNNGEEISPEIKNSETGKRQITVLWLDDLRNPEKYLFKKSESNTYKRNMSYYSKLFNDYDPKFVWVHNFEEFKNFILQNGLPNLVSFDFDLGAGLKKGDACAKFLKDYCTKNNISFPNYYIHSANPNAIARIKNAIAG